MMTKLLLGGLLVAAAAAIFEAVSRTLPGFFNKFVANFLPALAETLPKFLKKLHGPSACIVLSLTILDFFLVQIESSATNNLISLPDFKKCYFTMFFVEE